MRNAFPSLALASSFAVAVGIAACGSNGTGSTLTVSSAVQNAPSLTSSVTTASGTVSLQNLYLVVKEFDIRKASSGAVGPTGPTGPTGPSGPSGSPFADDKGASGPTGPSGPSGHDRQEVEAGPYVLEVAVGDSNLQLAIPTTVVPPGSYDGIEFEIHRVRSTDKLNLQTTKGGTKLDGLSIVLEGTCTGPATGTAPVAPPPTPFSVTSSMEVEVEYETAFTVAKGTATNVTLAFDASTWLAGPDGTTLDPCKNDPATNARIMANVKASLRAFGDDDRDGHDDRGEHERD